MHKFYSLDGKPTYPDVPDLEQAKTKPLPN